MALAPHPSPLPREREPVTCIGRSCAVAGPMASLADVRKTPPCEPPFARGENPPDEIGMNAQAWRDQLFISPGRGVVDQFLTSINASPLPILPAESVARTMMRCEPALRLGSDRLIRFASGVEQPVVREEGRPVRLHRGRSRL